MEQYRIKSAIIRNYLKRGIRTVLCTVVKNPEKGLKPLPLQCSGWWTPNGPAHLGPGPAWSPIRAQPHGWS